MIISWLTLWCGGPVSRTSANCIIALPATHQWYTHVIIFSHMSKLGVSGLPQFSSITFGTKKLKFHPLGVFSGKKWHIGIPEFGLNPVWEITASWDGEKVIGKKRIAIVMHNLYNQGGLGWNFIPWDHIFDASPKTWGFCIKKYSIGDCFPVKHIFLKHHHVIFTVLII